MVGKPSLTLGLCQGCPFKLCGGLGSRIFRAHHGFLSLRGGDAFPATGIGSHQTEIIHHDLCGESSVAFVAIGVFPKPRVALGQRLNPKLREFDPSGDDLLAAPDLEAETPDRKSVGCGRHREINVVTALNFAHLLTRTAPHATALHAQAEGLHIVSDCAFNLNSVGEPVLVAMDFIAREHRSLVFENSDDRALRQPAFCCVPETTIVPAVDQKVFPDNCTLQIVCH